MVTKLEQKSSTIVEWFDQQETHVFNLPQLRKILEEQRTTWKLPDGVSTNEFIQHLIATTALQRVSINSDQYSPFKKYIWRNPRPYEIALSLKADSYLSHGTAVFLHHLNDLIPSSIYVNKEQSKKPQNTGVLNQEGIDRAFANKQRTSNYIFSYEKSRITILSGKNTAKLGVITILGENQEVLSITNIERTLIDISVRPGYGGGVFQVLQAFKGAKDQVSISKLIQIYNSLNYTYPYHQAIGFYMEKAGYQEDQLKELRKLGITHDFYLDYAIPKLTKEYNSEWRLFFPKGL